jgi:ATP-binding cassette, subfamily C (CFTR/MRP), member 1
VTPITSLVAAVGYCLLSPLEHRRSIKPSTPILLFLAASFVCDGTQCILILQRHGRNGNYQVAVLAVLIDLVLLLVEGRSKRGLLLDAGSERSPEDTAGILSRTFFWWMNQVLANGYRKELQNEDLPKVDSELSSLPLRTASLRNWEQRRKLKLLRVY